MIYFFNCMTYANMCRVLAQVWSFASEMVLSYIVILVKCCFYGQIDSVNIASTQDNE